jgi:hypothetical protein
MEEVSRNFTENILEHFENAATSDGRGFLKYLRDYFGTFSENK